MIHSYMLKGSLQDTPQWWQHFVNSFNQNDLESSSILHTTLKTQYSGNLRMVITGMYILTFLTDEGHLMFMMKWR